MKIAYRFAWHSILLLHSTSCVSLLVVFVLINKYPLIFCLFMFVFSRTFNSIFVGCIKSCNGFAASCCCCWQYTYILTHIWQRIMNAQSFAAHIRSYWTPKIGLHIHYKMTTAKERRACKLRRYNYSDKPTYTIVGSMYKTNISAHCIWSYRLVWCISKTMTHNC